MTNESSSRFRDFATRLLAAEGALAERIEPEGLEADAAPARAGGLARAEFVRLGFAAELPPHAERVSLESDWLDRFGRLLGGRGRGLKLAVEAPLPALADPERLVERGLVLQNADLPAGARDARLDALPRLHLSLYGDLGREA